MDKKYSPGDQSTLREATVQEEIPTQAQVSTTSLQETVPRLNTIPLHGLWALTKRDLKKWYTNPYQLLISLIQPAVWLGLFGKAVNFGTFVSSAGASRLSRTLYSRASSALPATSPSWHVECSHPSSSSTRHSPECRSSSTAASASSTRP